MTAATVATLADRQEAARRRFAETGFPTLHDEAWRFTDIAPIAKARFVGANFSPGLRNVWMGRLHRLPAAE